MLALVEATGTERVEEPLELRLIKHERLYWRRSLAGADLKLSAQQRDQAVALATLLAARDRPGALRLLRRLPELTEIPAVGTWLRGLYPTDSTSRYWGSLQPDRLGEHHIGCVTDESPQLLAAIVEGAELGELEEAMVVIGRAISHQPHLEDQLRTLLAGHPQPLTTAVERAAERVANPLPLHRALRDPATDTGYRSPEVYGTPYQWGHGTSVSEHWSGTGTSAGYQLRHGVPIAEGVGQAFEARDERTWEPVPEVLAQLAAEAGDLPLAQRHLEEAAETFAPGSAGVSWRGCCCGMRRCQSMPPTIPGRCRSSARRSTAPARSSPAGTNRRRHPVGHSTSPPASTARPTTSSGH